jgi:hypothetical protein
MSFRRFASLALAMLKRDSLTIGLWYNVMSLSNFVPLRKILDRVSHGNLELYKQLLLSGNRKRSRVELSIEWQLLVA